MNKPLLPSGCYDLLPPYARQDTDVIAALLAVFEANGYEQVAPPLLEFTESLLSGRGAALSAQVFRVMDASAHKVMGIRPDITMQIARIANSRLATVPRPLRLSYAGDVLRMRPEGVRGSRQLLQAGIEIIGASSADADAEVIAVAAEALTRLGIANFTVDLNLPGLVSQLLATDALSNDVLSDIFTAVAHKDIAALKSMPTRHASLLAALVEISGPAKDALAKLKKLMLPESLSNALQPLEQAANAVMRLLPPAITLTIDPTEARGFEYHTGITFSFFTPGSTEEIGRGGRYRIEGAPAGSGEATGFTVYVDTLRRLLPQPATPKRVFLAEHADAVTLTELQSQGFIAIRALPEFGNSEEEARIQRCTHYWKSGKLSAL